MNRKNYISRSKSWMILSPPMGGSALQPDRFHSIIKRYLSKSFLPFFFFLLSLILILLSSCSDSPTDDGNTITVSGTVTLENREDHSGVTVGLYRPVELDTALVRINQQYPQIGLQISQETEFDHREHDPVYSTQSGSDGSWKIESVTPGTYHAVAEKDSFGWRYALDQSGNSINFGQLAAARFLSGLVAENINLAEGQQLVVETDVVLDGNLTLNDANTILLRSDRKLTFRKEILQPLSAGRLKISSVDPATPGRSVVFEGTGEKSVSDVLISHLKTGIRIETNANLSFTLQNAVIRDCQTGMATNNRAIALDKVIISRINGFAIETLSDYAITRGIIAHSDGCLFNDNGLGVLTNSCFLDNSIGITPFKGDSTLYMNNLFEYNDLAIAVNSSDCTISHSEFRGNGLDIELNRNYVQGNIFEYANPEIHNNNFINSAMMVSIWGEHPLYASGEYASVGVNRDITVPDCYWGSDNTFQIDAKIFDANDNPAYRYKVFYPDYKSDLISTAGIK